MEEEQPVATAEAAANLNDHGGDGGVLSRKEKRKALKKLKRKQMRKDAAVKEKDEEQALANDPEEQLRARLREQEESAVAERERKEFEERERLWLEAAEARRRKALEEEEEAEKHSRKLLEHELRQQKDEVDDGETDGEWEYVEEGPAEIIWKENEIIVKKKRVKVPKSSTNQRLNNVEDDRPTSNPLPPQSAAFAAYNSGPLLSAQELLESVAQQTPNFGTEQDKAHCPFHLKTGVCRFGSRCNRTHFYPDNSCTLLFKNMYGGPGLAWEQDEGLEVRDTFQVSVTWSIGLVHGGDVDYSLTVILFTDEEIERSYEEFYEDVHTEFLKFGEIINFKVCRNGSFHLRGNVYVHYKFLDSAVLAHSSMNGRYFAGKQIACEFVGVTRWKVAICGEYMKSRLKTCSRGTACNFIHYFCNPGGDYEWADWDNPPPKYWVKRMAVLFGPSDELESSKNVDMEDRDLHGDCRGRRTHTSDRSYSRSRHSDRNFQDVISEKDDSDEYRDRHTSSNKKDHSCRRKTRNNSEKKDYSNLHHLDVRYSSRHYSPRENGHLDKKTSTFENDEKSKDENHRNNESHKKYGRHGSSSQTRRGCFSEEHKNNESVSRKHVHYDRQCDSPDWDFYRGYEDTCGGKSICHSAKKASSRCTCDDSARYDGRLGSADHKSEREDSLAVKVSYGDLLGEGKEYQEYNSQNCLRNVSGDLKRESEHKSRRHSDRDRSISSGESFGDLKNSMDRNKKTLRDKVRNHQNSWSELEESDGSSQKSDNSLPGNGKKYSSHSKRRHHRTKRVQEDGEQANEHSYSADPDLRKKESRKRSRRGTPTKHSNSSRRKVRHGVHDS